MHKPFFSIITPTYNRAQKLEKLIENVLNQSFEDFEYIIVDDGSTDNTEEVVTSFTDKRIRYFKKDNEERGAARNFGLGKSEGKYINFFDSDDIMLENHLFEAKQYIASKSNVDILFSNYEIIDDHEKIVYKFNDEGIKLNDLILMKNIMSINSLFFKKKVIESHLFIENRSFKIGEDWLVWINLSLKYEIQKLDVVTTKIVQHDNRTMHAPTSKDLLKSYEIFHQYLDHDLDLVKINNIKFEQISMIAMAFAMEKNIKKAIIYLWRCVQYKPDKILSKRVFVVLFKMVL